MRRSRPFIRNSPARYRRFLHWPCYVLITATLLSPALLTPLRAADPPPNAVLILVDDQGWTGTSVKMDPSVPDSISDFYQTPNLERLAQQGMRFSNAYASAPNCSPTRAAIQTGRTPAQLQMTDVIGETNGASFFDRDRYKDYYTGHRLSPPVPNTGLSRSQITIAEHIKAAKPNYVTAHFGKWHLGGGGPSVHGYDFHSGESGNDPGNSRNDGDPKRIFSVTERANDFLEARVATDQPFFMQVSHYAVHTEIQALQETKDKYDGLPRGSRHRVESYAAMTEDLDSGVGMLLDKIDDLGIADNTIVIYVSDNGAGNAGTLTNNIPLSEGKATLREGGIRVPMIVRGPAVQADGVIHTPVTTADLFPTISDVLGIDTPLPTGLEGGSLRNVLENGGEGTIARPSEALFWHFPHYQDRLGTSPQSAVRLGDHKLIKIYETGELKLFDLDQDIGETRNLADLEPETRDKLHQLLNDWIEAVDASIPYVVSDNVELTWDGDQPGTRSGVWRATTDVQHRARESWHLPDDSPPRRVAIAPHQSNLPRHAFQFDGTSGMTHEFFHVSDTDSPVPDYDDSATFEMWMKIHSLTDGEQVLFETGGLNRGLSLTLEDNDSDGVSDALHFRVGGFGVPVAAKVDRFTDPTRNFVHVAGVLVVDGLETFAELYINGASVGRTEAGDIPIYDWDGVDEAGLGTVAGELGGDGGMGHRPFSGGNFKGQIAQFRFFNRSLDDVEILDHYNNALSPPSDGIKAALGDIILPSTRPASVAEGDYESDLAILVFHERPTLLDQDLHLDIMAPKGDMTSQRGGEIDWQSGTVPPGTAINSYFLHFDPIGQYPGDLLNAVATLSLDEEILGLIVDPQWLHETDTLLGAIGRYATDTLRELDLVHANSVAFFDDNRGLIMDLSAPSEQLIQLRIITAVPEPATFGLLTCLLVILLRASTRRTNRSEWVVRGQ